MSIRNPDHSDKATSFPEPGAANTGQYEEKGPRPEREGPPPQTGAGERRPTQHRDREEYQADPDGVAKNDPVEEDETAGGNEAAATPGETIRAFRNRS